MNKVTEKQLLKMAMEIREQAYAPYSKFHVGVALLCKDGTVVKGCNVENVSYGATICAERTAFCNAVSQGEHAFSAIAIVGGFKDKKLELCPPCGICRQVMAEFCDVESFRVILWNGDAETEPVIKTLAELLPYGFSKENLEK